MAELSKNEPYKEECGLRAHDLAILLELSRPKFSQCLDGRWAFGYQACCHMFEKIRVHHRLYSNHWNVPLQTYLGVSPIKHSETDF